MFALLPSSAGYKPGQFGFNVRAGGVKHAGEAACANRMQFCLTYVPCEVCGASVTTVRPLKLSTTARAYPASEMTVEQALSTEIYIHSKKTENFI